MVRLRVSWKTSIYGPFKESWRKMWQTYINNFMMGDESKQNGPQELGLGIAIMGQEGAKCLRVDKRGNLSGIDEWATIKQIV